jgi:excisionase family DNA binding protein
MSTDRDAITNGQGGQRQQYGNGPVERLLTLPELAERLQLSEKTIRRMIAGGRLPCVRLGRQLRFLPGDVFRWLAARKEG